MVLGARFFTRRVTRLISVYKKNAEFKSIPTFTESEAKNIYAEREICGT